MKKWATVHRDRFHAVLGGRYIMHGGLPHFLLNGALELLRWVHDQGFEIVFFSNAVVERNRELCPIIMERAFGKGKEPTYRVLSRGDCVDTTWMDDGARAALQGRRGWQLL